jgi:hypothetical protein
MIGGALEAATAARRPRKVAHKQHPLGLGMPDGCFCGQPAAVHREGANHALTEKSHSAIVRTPWMDE